MRRGKKLFELFGVDRGLAFLTPNFFVKRYSHNVSTSLRSSQWLPVIGLEIHAQIASNSKLFSGSSTNNYAPLNSVVSHFDCALPGTLPVLNKACVEAAVSTALALKCQINHVSRFDRKHYFYADLPAGYQITQFNNPVAKHGEIEFYVFDSEQFEKPYKKKTKVFQLQLEQDSGKSVVDDKNNRVLVDYNRVGCGLMEIVMDHNLCNGLEAACLLRELISLLKSVGTCDCKLEKGQFRVDANISVHKHGEPLGTRTEVKNLNSVRFVYRAIEFEIQRQIALLENNQPVVNETRTFDFKTKSTIPMRDKEVRQDYRYMPEPNLPPLHLFSKDKPAPSAEVLDPKCVVNIDEIRKSLPKLYSTTRDELVSVHKIPVMLLLMLEEEVGCIDYLQKCLQYECNGAFVAQQISLLNSWLNHLNTDFVKTHVKPPIFAELCTMFMNESITHQIFLKLLHLYESDQATDNPTEIVKKNDWIAITDTVLIGEMCDKVLSTETAAVKDFLKGKSKVMKRFIRRADANFNGRVSADELETCFSKKLDKMKNNPV